MKILLADDDTQFRTSIKTLLEKLGHEVVEACNGGEAFELVTDDSQEFDAVITDQSMPIMSGANILQAMWRNHAPPALLHSAETFGYLKEPDGRRQIDLYEFVSYFDFAEFHLKDGSDYIEDFLTRVESRREK